MADLTIRMTAADFLASMYRSRGQAGRAKRTSKFGNRKTITESGEKYDSNKELAHHQALEAARHAADPAQQVVRIERQVPFLLIPKQDGERAVTYYADFVVHYADGRKEVHDTKSPPTRMDKAYVIKRKLMLAIHAIRIQEF